MIWKNAIFWNSSNAHRQTHTHAHTHIHSHTHALWKLKHWASLSSMYTGKKLEQVKQSISKKSSSNNWCNFGSFNYGSSKNYRGSGNYRIKYYYRSTNNYRIRYYYRIWYNHDYRRDNNNSSSSRNCLGKARISFSLSLCYTNQTAAARITV